MGLGTQKRQGRAAGIAWRWIIGNLTSELWAEGEARNLKRG